MADELEVRSPTPWLLVGGSALIGLALIGGGIAAVARGGLLRGIVVGGLGVVELAFAARVFRPLRVTASEAGLDLLPAGATERRRVAWDDVFGLGASRGGAGSTSELVFHIWLADGSEARFLARWGDADRLAARVQNRGSETPALDTEAALANGRRPDAAAAVGVDAARLDEILGVIEADLRERGFRPRVHRPRLQARVWFGDGEHLVELFSVSRVLAAADRARGPELAKRHYDALVRGRAAAAALDEAKPTLAEATPSLRRQVTQTNGELQFSTVLDLDETILAPSAALIAHWATPPERLAELARANVRALPAPATQPLPSLPAARLFIGDDYTAARVESLAELLPLPEAGAVIALPAQTALLVLPMTDPADLFVLTIGVIDEIIALVQAREPRVLGRELYWWRAGALVKIPAVIDARGRSWIIPDGLSGRLTGRIAAD